MKFVDLTGQRFGRLTVVDRAENDKRNQAKWHCRCDCGTDVVVYSYNLRNGNSKSCGCLNRENLHSGMRTTHGDRRTRLYRIWCNMLDRCNNIHASRFPNYAGRGISVCQEWHEYTSFKDWAIRNGYRDDLSIDRIDVNGNYEPCNCRWATKEIQDNNKRRSHFLLFKGKKMTISQWSSEVGIPASVIENRINRLGWSVDKALTQPMRELPRRKKIC